MEFDKQVAPAGACLIGITIILKSGRPDGTKSAP